MQHHQHLGAFSDLVPFAQALRPLFPLASPGQETQRLARESLAFEGDETPREVRVESHWRRDGIEGEEVSWSVGYGPRTRAWVLKPEGSPASTCLPGVVALHDHGGFKYLGREKIADGADGARPELQGFRDNYYGGRAWPNELARRGFVVLVPDAFLWGSRRFDFQTMPEGDRDTAKVLVEHSLRQGGSSGWDGGTGSAEIAEYNCAAASHEHLVEKYCHLLNTTLAGIVAFEDRVAASYLASRADVDGERIGCAGLSGGGCRSALLQATCERIRAAVVVGMMSTFEGLLDHNVASHTWMLLPSAWPRHGDWPDLAACRAPSPLLVQFDEQDNLFTPQGMRAAHTRLSEHYAQVGAPDAYRGEFYPGGHKFDVAMQEAACGWLGEKLGSG